MIIDCPLIKSVPLQRFKNATHVAFAQFVVKSFELYPLVSTMFDRAVKMVEEANRNEDFLFQRFEHPFLTKEKKECDAHRINLFFMLRDVCRVALRSDQEELRACATKILRLSNMYGGRRLGMISQGQRSGLITNFIADLEEKLQQEIDTLDAADLVANLEQSNLNFMRIQEQRLQESAIYNDMKFAELRADSDFAIRTLFSQVNDASKTGLSELHDYIHYLNAAIAQYTFGLGKRPPKKDPAAETSGDEGGLDNVEIIENAENIEKFEKIEFNLGFEPSRK